MNKIDLHNMENFPKIYNMENFSKNIQMLVLGNDKKNKILIVNLKPVKDY